MWQRRFTVVRSLAPVIALIALAIVPGADIVLAQSVAVEVGSATGAPGGTVAFDVTLNSPILQPVAVQFDIEFEPLTPIAAGLGILPDCTVNPGINKPNTVFVFEPFGCTYGVDCTSIRAIVISFFVVTPIPDGSTLISCNVAIDSNAPDGVYPLTGVGCNASDMLGMPLPTTCAPGSITVTSPTPPLDAFKCYKLKKDNVTFPSSAALSDQFASETVEIKKAFLWCNPVSTNGGPINSPLDHLLCYKIKGSKLDPNPHLATSNDFGTSSLFAKKPFLLCVPGSKTIIP